MVTSATLSHEPETAGPYRANPVSIVGLVHETTKLDDRTSVTRTPWTPAAFTVVTDNQTDTPRSKPEAIGCPQRVARNRAEQAIILGVQLA